MLRRTFLKKTGLALGGTVMIAPGFFACTHLKALPSADQIVYRFIVGGDIHFGAADYETKAAHMVSAMNREKANRGLDLFVLNGDLVHDDPDMYTPLKVYLDKLEAPCYTTKGNHDFLRDDQRWEQIFGYPENHVIEEADMAFILADTSIGENMKSHYSAADRDWLETSLKKLKGKTHVFIFMHIAQRMEGVEVEGYTWPTFGVGHQDPARAVEGEAVMRTLASFSNITGVFHGHNHNEVDRYMSDGIPYFFCSRLGHSWGNKVGYRVVERYKDGTWGTYMWNAEDAEIMNNHVL